MHELNTNWWMSGLCAIALTGVVWVGGCRDDAEYLDGYEPTPEPSPSRQASEPDASSAPTPTADTREPGGDDSAAAAETATASFLGLEGPIPASWSSEPPQNSMIHTNYAMPAPGGGDPAFVNVYFFGRGMGGSVDDNVQRWAGQFRGPDGGPVQPTVRTLEADGMPVTFVELAGAYQGMGDADHRPDHMLLAAIVEAPAGRIFIRTVGETTIIEHHRDAFMRFIRELRKADG